MNTASISGLAGDYGLSAYNAGKAGAINLTRRAAADELAAVVCFLASDDASFVTGAAIVADGGITAHTGIPGPGR